MPNWCENELVVRGKAGVLAYLAAIEGQADEDGRHHIDFQKILPMPAILEGTVPGSSSEMGRVLLGDDDLGQKMLSYPWVQAEAITTLEQLQNYIRQHHPESENDGKRSLQAEKETGCRDWLEWRAGTMENHFQDGHWGTKWNACHCAPLENATDQRAKLEFSTAWSPPTPVILELSRQFPLLTFTLKYWEGLMGFRGVFRVKAGNVLCDADYDYRGPRGG
jgi:hypothetical protein